MGEFPKKIFEGEGEGGSFSFNYGHSLYYRKAGHTKNGCS